MSELLQLREVFRPQRRYADRPGDVLARGDRPRHVPQQVALRERGRRVAGWDRAERQVEQRRGDVGVDPLVLPHGRGVVAAEVEERLPADEPAWRTRPATKVDGVGLALPGRVKDHAEE